MAARTSEFREVVLELDNYHCQMCGFDGRDEKQRGILEADHVIPRAGKPSMDDPDNGITLCSLCHKKKTAKDLNIVHWDRDDREAGLIVTDGDGNEVTRLWFYAETDRRLLEHGLEVLRLMATSDSKKARILAHVWNNYHLTDATPEQLVSQVGLDPNDSAAMANAYIAMEKAGLEWPIGMNLAKAKLVVECASRIAINANGETEESPERAVDRLQDVIGYACDFSYTDFEKELIEQGFLDGTSSKVGKRNIYMYIPRAVFDEFVTVYSGADPEMSERCGSSRGVAVRIAKVIMPLRKHGGKLSIKDGIDETDIEVISLVPHSEHE